MSASSTVLPWWSSAGATAACYHEPKVHDHELYFQLHRINLLLLLPLSLLGLLSNACALVCLCTPPRISSGVFIYLRALLILDHCHICVVLANSLLPDFCDSHHSPEHTAYRFCMFERRFLRALVPRMDHTVNTLHVWTIASLAAHRYWKISRPVVSRFKDTVGRARSLLTLLFVAIIIYRLPIFLVELQLKWHPVFRIQKRAQTTELLSPYRVALYSVIDPILSNFLPFALMCAFSLLTLCEIVKSRHFAYAQFSIDSGATATSASGANNAPPGDSLKRRRSSCTGHPCLRRRTDGVRQKQDYRATVSIVLIILLYLLLHSMELYILARKWQLLSQDHCPTRADYLQSHISKLLSVLSASVNAFVFIAFTHRMRTYIQMLIRKTSRSLSSNSSEPQPPAKPNDPSKAPPMAPPRTGSIDV